MQANSLLFQWGLENGTLNANTTVSFIVSYPNTDYVVFTKPQNNKNDTNTAVTYRADVYSKRTNGFTANTARFGTTNIVGDNTQFAWLAIGVV